MLSKLWQSNCCPIGLDAGSNGVRLLQLRRQGQGFCAIAAASGVIASDLTAEQRVEATTDVVRRLLRENPFVGRKVVSCLPSAEIEIKNLRMPKMPTAELEKAVQWEARDRMGQGKDCRLQFIDAGEVRQGEESRQEVIVMAASQPVLDRHMQLLSACDLEPLAVEVAPSALARCVWSLAEPDTSEVQAILEIGYSASKMLIVRHGLVVFFKLIDIGGRKLDETVASHLNLSIQDAAAIRWRLTHEQPDQTSSASSDATVQRAVHEAAHQLVTDLATELTLCLRYYSVTFRGQRPNDVLVLGGQANDQSLIDALRESTKVNVRVYRPFERIDVRQLPQLGDDASHAEWAAAAGMSMRRVTRRNRRRAA